MISEQLAFGTTWFWIISGIAFFWVLACLEGSEGGQGAGFVLFLYLGAIYLWGSFNPFPWLIANPFLAIGIAAVYLIAGTAWALVKWRFYVASKARELQVILKGMVPEKTARPALNALSAEDYDMVAAIGGLDAGQRSAAPRLLGNLSRHLAAPANDV